MKKEDVAATRAFLFDRQKAYQLVFQPSNLYVPRVLEDLAAFCRANETTFHSDPRLHAALEGRREVFLRIQHHLKMDSESLWAKYSKGNLV